MSRILTTHAGSIIRPDTLLDFVATMERGEPIDERGLRGRALAMPSRTSCAGRRRRASTSSTTARWASRAGSPISTSARAGSSRGWWQPRAAASIRRAATGSRSPSSTSSTTGSRRKRPSRRWGWSCPTHLATTTAPLTRRYIVTGPLEYDSSALQRDIANFKQALDGVDVVDTFLPVVAPASAYWLDNEHYATDEEFVFALADVLHEEYKAIVDAGFLLQVDDAVLVHEYDSILSLGGSVEDYRRWAELRVEATNHALSGIPEERVRYHVCHGSWHGPHVFDPPLREVIDLVLRVKARYYLFEQANARHEHEWRLWEDVELPEGKVLIPGVVSHHTIVVEHPELVAERLVRLAGLVGPENVMGGTDCGFAQGAFLRRVHPSIQWAKLEALAEGARLASKQLSAGKSAA